MCVVSNIGDGWNNRWYPSYPYVPPVPTTPAERVIIHEVVSNADLDALRREVEQLRRELAEAKAQDVAEGNPDCENEAKFVLIRRLADELGIDLNDVLGANENATPDSPAQVPLHAREATDG